MTKNIAEHVREKIAREIRIADTLAAESRARYAELVRDALASVARCERRRMARGTVAPVAAFTESELAWFRRSVR